jgi:hypothetical protein
MASHRDDRDPHRRSRREPFRDRDEPRRTSRGDADPEASDYPRDPYAPDFFEPPHFRHGSGRQAWDQPRGDIDRVIDAVSAWLHDARAGEQADHRGKGPSGYRRSDARILEDISDRLTADSRVDASRIEVAVTDGEVTLAGEVDSKYAKRRAEDCADSVYGVRHVQNNLRVDAPDAPRAA